MALSGWTLVTSWALLTHYPSTALSVAVVAYRVRGVGVGARVCVVEIVAKKP